MPRRAPYRVNGELQKECTEFVRNYIANNPLHLSALNENEFKLAMNAITKAMVAAWVDGYHCELR